MGAVKMCLGYVDPQGYVGYFKEKEAYWRCDVEGGADQISREELDAAVDNNIYVYPVDIPEGEDALSVICAHLATLKDGDDRAFAEARRGR